MGSVIFILIIVYAVINFFSDCASIGEIIERVIGYTFTVGLMITAKLVYLYTTGGLG
jgi:hypothetical protein